MFAKAYGYSITSDDFDRWKSVMMKARSIYARYGELDSKDSYLFRVKGAEIEILELGFYESEAHWREIYEAANADPDLESLWTELCDIVDPDAIEEIDFQTLDIG